MTRASSSSRRRQHRRQMKKTKVFSGFTNQLKVFGRLWGKTRCQVPPPPPAPPPAGAPTPVPPPHLGFSKGSGSFRPFPTGRFSASSMVSSSTLPPPSPRERGNRGRALRWAQARPPPPALSLPHPPTVRMWTLPPGSVNAKSSHPPFASSASSCRPRPPAVPVPHPPAPAASLQATSHASGGSERGCTYAWPRRRPAARSRARARAPPHHVWQLQLQGSCKSSRG